MGLLRSLSSARHPEHKRQGHLCSPPVRNRPRDRKSPKVTQLRQKLSCCSNWVTLSSSPYSAKPGGSRAEHPRAPQKTQGQPSPCPPSISTQHRESMSPRVCGRCVAIGQWPVSSSHGPGHQKPSVCSQRKANKYPMISLTCRI